MDEQRFGPREIVRGDGEFEAAPKGLGTAMALMLAFALIAGGLAAYVYITSSDGSEPTAQNAPARSTSAGSRRDSSRRAAPIRKQSEPPPSPQPASNRAASPSGNQATPAVRVAESRSRDDIRRVVEKHLPTMRRAYRKRLEKMPEMSGTVKVRFVIENTGNVVHAEVVSSDTEDPPFDRAIVKYVQRWIFPPVDEAGDSTVVVYPFIFSPE